MHRDPIPLHSQSKCGRDREEPLGVIQSAPWLLYTAHRLFKLFWASSLADSVCFCRSLRECLFVTSNKLQLSSE